MFYSSGILECKYQIDMQNNKSPSEPTIRQFVWRAPMPVLFSCNHFSLSETWWRHSIGSGGSTSCCIQDNRRFPSCLSPLFQSESQCEAFHMEISFIHMYHEPQVCVWIKLISIWKALHLDSLWNRLGNRLFRAFIVGPVVEIRLSVSWSWCFYEIPQKIPQNSTLCPE